MNTERHPTPTRLVGPREGEDWIGQGRNVGNPPLGYAVDVDCDGPVLLTCQREARAMHAAWTLAQHQKNWTAIARQLNSARYRPRVPVRLRGAPETSLRYFSGPKARRYAAEWDCWLAEG